MLTEEIRRAQAGVTPTRRELLSALAWHAGAHRGAKGVATETTLARYRAAWTTPPTGRRTARRSRSSPAIFQIDGRGQLATMLKIGISAASSTKIQARDLQGHDPAVHRADVAHC